MAAAAWRPAAARPPVICVDPGHPSEVSDALVVQNGTTENHINWVVALKLKPRLQAAGYRVVLTKQSERQRVTNRRRAEIANACGAVLMVRLHCDTGSGTGFCVYYPDAPGRHGDVVGPPVFVCRESGRAAQAMRVALAAGLKNSLNDNGAKNDRSTLVGSRYGALIGSIHSLVPTITIEMAYLSNARDAAFVKSEAGQGRLADALADGVRRFVSSSPAQQQERASRATGVRSFP